MTFDYMGLYFSIEALGGKFLEIHKRDQRTGGALV
jgi:hypothetical protein